MLIKDIFFTLAEEFSYTVNENTTIQKTENDITSSHVILIDFVKILNTQDNKLFNKNPELTKIKKKISKNEKINFYMFLESLALVALNMKYNESLGIVDKLLYLIEKMNQSKGINKSQLRTGHTL